jgi:hypothetical protein
MRYYRSRHRAAASAADYQENTMKYLLSVLLAFAAAFAAAPAQSASAAMAPTGAVKFVSGGVGDDSAEQMAALGREYNLKLLFAAKDGHYLAEVEVKITDEGNRSVLSTVAEGPFLFARLAPGKYQVTSSYAGVAQTRQTTIAASGRRELIFRWEEPQD